MSLQRRRWLWQRGEGGRGGGRDEEARRGMFRRRRKERGECGQSELHFFPSFSFANNDYDNSQSLFVRRVNVFSDGQVRFGQRCKTYYYCKRLLFILYMFNRRVGMYSFFFNIVLSLIYDMIHFIFSLNRSIYTPIVHKTLSQFSPFTSQET